MKNNFDRLEELKKILDKNKIKYNDNDVLDDRIYLSYLDIFIILDKKSYKIDIIDINGYTITKTVYKLNDIIKDIKKIISLYDRLKKLNNDIKNFGEVIEYD